MMASGNSVPETIRITIPSRLDFLGILNHTITELGEYLKLEEEVVDALAISVIEADGHRQDLRSGRHQFGLPYRC